MEYANNIKQDFNQLKERVIVAIETNLKRIGLNFHADGNDGLEFFEYCPDHENVAVEGIMKDGTVELENGETTTIRGYIEDDSLPVDSALLLLEELEQI